MRGLCTHDIPISSSPWVQRTTGTQSHYQAAFSPCGLLADYNGFFPKMFSLLISLKKNERGVGGGGKMVSWGIEHIPWAYSWFREMQTVGHRLVSTVKYNRGLVAAHAAQDLRGNPHSPLKSSHLIVLIWLNAVWISSSLPHWKSQSLVCSEHLLPGQVKFWLVINAKIQAKLV